MRVSNIDKTSFGTKPFVTENTIDRLRKYNINLTKGILGAFKKLSHNLNDDVLILTIGSKKEAKKLKTEAVCLTLYTRNKNFLDSIIFASSNIFKLKNSVILTPKSMENLSAKKIAKALTNNYKKLDEKPAGDNIKNVLDDTMFDYKNISNSHQKLLDKLKNYVTDNQ